MVIQQDMQNTINRKAKTAWRQLSDLHEDSYRTSLLENSFITEWTEI